jgi:hypothetical protein
MNKIKAIALGVFIFALFACEQPFKAGLGPVVDIRPPTVTLTSPGAGSYINGITTFVGTAEDDYRLASVMIKVLDYPDKQFDFCKGYVPVNLIIQSNTGNWDFSINTKDFPDGDIKIQLLVTDTVNKSTETNPILFIINNSQPVITVTNYPISRGMINGEVGGENLNYGAVHILPAPLTYERKMAKGASLAGTISHEEGIYTDSVNPAYNLYPPQIRLWRVEDIPSDPSYPSWKPGHLPSEAEVPWKNFGDDNLFPLSGSVYQFLYPLPDAGYFYGFEIRAQTTNGRMHLRYPRDVYSPQNPPRNWNRNADDIIDDDELNFVKQNRYVLVYVSAPQQPPTLDLYNLENFLSPAAWNGSAYNPLPVEERTEPYPYVDKTSSEQGKANKNGDFILRLKAQHPEGISSAELYWENVNTKERGRFIWDPANVRPDSHSDWNKVSLVATTNAYSFWGYEDPNSEGTGFFQIRSFIFTYRHGGNNLIPNNDTYHGQVRNRSKIQRLRTGNDVAWALRSSGSLPSYTQLQADAIWENIAEMPEGEYKVEAYTRSRNDTPKTTPTIFNFKLDRKGPDVEVRQIEGTRDFKPAGTTIVNGVISPKMSILDMRAQDSNLRSKDADDTYFGVYEQRYIVIREADKTAFETVLNNNKGWLPMPGSRADNWIIPGTTLTVPKHGPVVSNTFEFKTSMIYNGATYSTAYGTLPNGLSLSGATTNETDYLPDGAYYLYVFARDNAFNVGQTSIKFEVDHLSDFPEFDFKVGGSITPDVTNPSTSVDLITDYGFQYYINGTNASGGIGVRNRMATGTPIRLLLRDDDSLDLGTETVNSSIDVKIAGSSNSEGNIEKRSTEVSLAKDVIRTIFGYQSNDRVPIKETPAREISQAALVTALKGNTYYTTGAGSIPGLAGATTSLPDGIYWIQISVSDYPGTVATPTKLLAGGTSPAASASNKVEFWVAVDNTAPEIYDVQPVSGGAISFTPLVVGDPDYVANRSRATIRGKVSDQNGPITGEVVGVKKASGGTTTIRSSKLTLDQPEVPSPSLWVRDFVAEIVLDSNIESTTYIFTLEFKDRFDTKKTIDLRYTFDREPPTVAINSPIKTFSRELRSDGYDPYPSIPPVDFERLTNGIVSFDFIAKDNQKGREARWWLVPYGTTLNSFAFDAYNATENPNGIRYDTATDGTTLTITNNGIKYKAGKLTDNFTEKTWYLNTNDLADGRYILYAAAEDDANNFSGIKELQTIYILQPEDMPWFGAKPNITPNKGSGQEVIGASGAFVRGSIFEDDGFFDVNGDALAGSVIIYMSSAPTAGTIKDHQDFINGTWPGTTGWTQATVPVSALTRAGNSSNVTIAYDLRPAFGSAILNTDGLKHYVIEARDSWFGKFTTETGTSATGATELTSKIRRHYFSFEYDSVDPVITVSKPSSGASFGRDSNTNASLSPFSLTATISDVHLDTLANGNYYISWKLDNTGDYKVFDLGIKEDSTASTVTGITDITNSADGTGLRTITFTISAAVFTQEICKEITGGYANLPSGNHTLSLQVKDQSNKIGNAPLSFLIDKDPPIITFNTINGLPLPNVPIASSTLWWNVATNAAGYQAKRTALEAMPTKLTVLQHEAGSDVTIKGSFADNYSNIASTFEYSIDNTGDWTTVNMGTVDTKSVDWQIDIPASKVPDGVHSISIRVADVGGNVTNNPAVYYGFIVVSQKPTVNITTTGNPVQGDRKTIATVNDGDTVFAVGGNASSASLDHVRLKISYTDDSDIPAWTYSLPAFTPANLIYTTSPYTETGNWTYNVPRTALYTAGGNAMVGATFTDTSLRSGNYELSAVSVDKSGIESDEKLWTFIVDAEKPKFEFTTPRYTDAIAPGTVRPASYWIGRSDQNVIMSTEPKLQISLSDDNDLIAAQYQIRKFNYASNTWGNYYTAIINDGNVVWNNSATESWPDVSLVRGTDLAWSLDIKDLEDGYYYVRIRAKDESIIINNTVNTWVNNANGNPATSDYGYFFLSRTPPTLTNVDSDKIQFSSKVISDNILKFKVNATDATWFQKLEVKVEPQMGGTYSETIGYPSPNYLYYGPAGATTGVWEPELSIRFPTTLPDGMYKITFTLTNIAGIQNTTSRTITLDNTAPEGTVESPQIMNVGSAYLNAYPYPAGVSAGPGTTIYGGEASAILGGTTDDKGANGSASGVAEIWYHLGYVGNAANNSANNAALIFPTEATVRGNGVTGLTLIGGNDLGGAANNARFDVAANSLTTQWFKYESGFPTPHGVDPLVGDVDKINWELVIKRTANTEIANYAKGNFTLKTGSTTRYNNANGAWMVKQIDSATLPSAIRKNGLYSMPLWIRVADTAGNVHYFCRDIWLYPNGDYPSNTFSRPSANKAQGEPEGGQFSILGDASDNISVKKVMYRIKADNVRSTTANWQTAVPDDNKIVFLEGVDELPSDEFSIPDYGNFTPTSNPFADSPVPAGKLSKNGWYFATLESGAAPTVSWSVIVNAQNEITNGVMLKPASDNRWFELSPGVKYTRLYIEVFVFDADEYGNYNKISLGKGTDTVPAAPESPKPDILVLYMTSSAPNIDNLLVSNKDGSFDSTNGNDFTTGDFSEYKSTDPQNERLRSRRFAVRMDLDGSTRPISLMSVRHYEKGTTAPSWTDIPVTGPYNDVTLTGANAGIHLNGNADNSSIKLTYAFDSLRTTALAGPDYYASIQNGAWASSGGTYVIEVRIQDSQQPPGTASTRFEIGIDNFAPVADEERITNTKVAGTNVSFLGRAFDYSLVSGSTPVPSYRGIESVYAWFTRDSSGKGNYINLNYVSVDGNPSGAVKASVDTQSRPAWTGRKAAFTWVNSNKEGNAASITVAAGNVGTREDDFSYPTEPGYFKLLSAETGGNLSNRITWQPNNNNNADIYWSFIANTVNMPDGWIYLNYLVIDNAGNATFYQQRMMVRNNYPEITGVTLFTDNRGEGAAFTQGEQNDPNSSFDYVVNNGTGTGVYEALGYLNSGFISKNEAIGFEVRTVKGNGNLNYRVQYVDRKLVPLTTAILKLMTHKTYGASIGNINLYTIEDRGSISNLQWNMLGVKELNPGPGNHFVCTSYTELPDTTIDALNVGSAKVWCYTMPGPTTETTPPTMLKREKTNTGNTASANDLRFLDVPGGANYFDVSGGTKIPERLGSRPEELQYDDSSQTAFFIIKVWDSVSNINTANIPPADLAVYTEDDQLYDVVVIGMNVYLSDHMNPTIRLYDLNPYTELSVLGSNSTSAMQTRTMENAAHPTAIGANILRGGLFNVNTNTDPIRSGYIEPRDNSTALQPWIMDAYSGVPGQQNANGYVGTPGNGYSADTVTVTTPVALDRVSGRIILRGQAWDDQLIDEIRINISTTAPTASNGTATTILKLQGDGADRAITSYNGARAWAVEEMHWKTGHTVEWAYILNTEDYPLGVAYITVSVKDKNGSSGGLFNGDPDYPTAGAGVGTGGTLNNNRPILLTSQDQKDSFHNQLQVTITPYVVGFVRADEYATNRSLQGWYSFFQGEQGIRLLGYNLGNSAPTMYIRHGAVVAGEPTTNATVMSVTNNGAASTFAPRRYTFNIPANARSGRIEVTSGGTGATAVYNHESAHANRSWNRESNANISGSGLWVNKPYAHVWRTEQDNDAPRTFFGGSATGTTSSNPTSPGMQLEYSNAIGGNPGRLHAAWTSFGDATYFYGDNNGTRTAMQTAPSGDPFGETDISLYNGSINLATGNAPNISVVYQNDGAPYVALRTTINTIRRLNNNGTVYNTNNANGADGEHRNAKISATATELRASERWRNTRIAKAAANIGNVADPEPRDNTDTIDQSGRTTQDFLANRAYITAYDSQGKYLWFGMRYNNNTANNDHGNYTRIIDGATANQDGTTLITTATGSNSVAASANKGEFSAVDYDGTGPVIAYYDQANDTVRIAFGTLGTTGTNRTIDSWTRWYLLPTGHALYRGSGTHISIKVDSSNKIHLAFYNSTYKTLVYANLTRPTTMPTGNSLGVTEIYTVDNIIEGGTWTDISVDGSGNPWIVYGDIGRKGNTDGARLAYKSSANTGIAFNSGTANRLRCPVTGADISTWEAVTMPSQYPVKDDRLNIEAWPPTVRGGTLGNRPDDVTWKAAIGYASTWYRIGYFFNPAWRDTGVTW